MRSVAFSSDDKYLATAAGSCGRVYVWRGADLISQARSRLRRNLTAEEWLQYLPEEPYRKTFSDLP